MTLSAGHVFISHGTENRDEARALCAFIEGRGIRTWIAPRDVRPGQDYSEQLQSAIEGCTAFVVLVTEKANSSPYVRAETEMAFSGDKPIFPVRNADIQPGAGLAFFLKIRHWTDAFGADGDAAMERLGRELQALFGVDRTAPAAPAPAAPPPKSATPVPPPAAAAPAWSPAPPQTPVAGASDDRLRAAIGPKADWYLDAWRRMDARASKVSWNWAAFLATIFWFAYRKMWVPLVAGVFAFLLLDFIAALTPAMVKPGWLILFALAIAAGAFGNHLYRRQVTRLAEETAAFEHPLALAQATTRGGTSTPALATALGIFALLVVAGAVAQSNQAARVTPAPPAPAPAPSTDTAQTQPPVTPAPQPTPAPPPPDAAGTVTFDSTYLLGRWTENGDCAAGSAFNADGTFTSDGGTGTWIANGDRVTLTGSSATVTVQIVPIDQNTMTVVAPSGSARETRC